MEHETYLAHIAEQSDALRAAAGKAGPDAQVPTCPQWTVHDLVSHIGGVHALVCAALERKPEDTRPKLPVPPTAWEDLLTWWDEQRSTMVERLHDDPAKRVWSFLPELGSVGWWARRQAHETSIHRLDAEHAVNNAVPTLLFDSEHAADGIDEIVVTISPFMVKRRPPEIDGTLLVHAADAGRAWLLKAEGGKVTAGPVPDAGTDADANLVGTADAVYRAAWKRPSTAIYTGNPELRHTINGG
ncbi:maleylpyruvate isomerase family mycothiol-dependent enzyme [Actinocrispum wychmicini]|uniref:Uncharacterized protein (TIGR03083 family) n=1 Tax=Actinocrispum wychmicini TaxID=1213861 RepID=A0A4R2KF86_9PSEU|nr:maleylpyruvate isomerase family mycothiol-dependent enzyme [Actinocrispum wychmicini]TCO65195.1 uncharacterized protein (TIGR03083 family) [Actinocrispum wychmicini]